MSIGPYVAVIGPPRCGTTWLYRYLKENCGAFTGWIKEIDWFAEHWGPDSATVTSKQADHVARIDAKLVSENRGPRPWEQMRKDRAALRDTAGFRRFFEKWAAPGQPVMDVSPRYFGLGCDAYADMDAHFPGARVVLLLRNPADRAWATAAHWRKVFQSQEPVEAWAERGLRLDAQMAQRDGMTGICRAFTAASAVLGTDRVHTLFTEDLFSPRRMATLQALCDFIGCDHRPAPEFEFSGNKGSYPPMPETLRARATQEDASSFAFALARMGRLPDNWQADWDRYVLPGLAASSSYRPGQL